MEEYIVTLKRQSRNNFAQQHHSQHNKMRKESVTTNAQSNKVWLFTRPRWQSGFLFSTRVLRERHTCKGHQMLSRLHHCISLIKDSPNKASKNRFTELSQSLISWSKNSEVGNRGSKNMISRLECYFLLLWHET